uniref:Uncharacterized protein n=1 Tax=Anguilla anguilla TaxID=7936 RepID=A0A0E9PH70_ANGAN
MQELICQFDNHSLILNL